MGRELQKAYGKPQQSILTMPILEGLDGVQKMSKSLNNYIGINEPANDMFGKIMSISDELMWRYFELLSFRPLAEIEEFKTQVDNGENPRDIKFILAKELISRFHSEQAATDAQNDFINRFSKNAIPDDMPEVKLVCDGNGLVFANILKEAGLVASTSEAHRMVKQGAVKIDGERVEDSKQELHAGFLAVVQIGKRKFARIQIV
jgi:tyrosyl-tRNA synthetase